MKRIFSILLSSALVALVYPPHDLEFLAWVALVPLLMAIRGERPFRSFLLCHLFGGIMVMGVYCWINIVKGFSPVHFVLLGVYLGFYYGLFGLLLNWIAPVFGGSSLVAAPSLWVAMEYLRSNAGFMALPWPNLGNSQYETLPVIQIASVTGVYGVSFLIVMVNAAIGEIASRMLRKEDPEGPGIPRGILKPAVIPLLCVAGTLAFGWAVLHRETGSGTVAVTVIQGNIAQGRKWDPVNRAGDLSKHLRLSEAAIRNDNAALIAWPETAVSGSLPRDPVLYRAYSGLAREARAHLLVGNAPTPKLRYVAGRTRVEKMYNSAFLFSPEGTITKSYSKIILVPVGEYIPYRNRFPWPPGIAKALDVDFWPGKEYTVFSLDGVPFSVYICWESMFPDLVRRFVQQGARFMVNITNEAYFGETAAPYQYLAMNVFRAVENRVAVVRCANTGVSCFINPRGEVYGRLNVDGRDLFVEGYLTKEVPLRDETTFYTRHGDLFAQANVLLTCIGMIGCAVLKDPAIADGGLPA